MTISSPQPGIFISRPSWIGSGAIGAAHTPGNPGFNLHRRADGDTVAAALAIEEAYWERAYHWWTYTSFPNWNVPAPQYAVFGTADRSPGTARYASFDDLAYPTAATGSPVYPTKFSTPQDRAFSTRRIYRPALRWMLRNLLWSPVRGAPFFLNFLRDGQYIQGSATPSSWAPGAVLDSATTPSSSLLDPNMAAALPSFVWTAPENVISAMASWQGGHTLDACANDGIFRNAAPDRAPGGLAQILGCLGVIDWRSEGALPDGWEATFAADHQVSALGAFGSIISGAFGKAFDYAILRDGADNRRLWYDLLGAYSQVVASIDRLYGTLEVSQFSDSHNNSLSAKTRYKVTGSASGTIPASAIDLSGRYPAMQPGTQVSWGATTYQQTTVNEGSESTHGDVIAAVQEGKCVSNADAAPISLAQIRVDQPKIGELLNTGELPAQDVPFAITPPLLRWSDHDGQYFVNYEISRTDTSYTVRVAEPVTLAIASQTLTVAVEGVAEYLYWNPMLAPPYMDNTFPGAKAWQAGVVREVEACQFFLQAEAEDIQDVISNDAELKMVSCARGVATSQSGFAGLFSQWRGQNIERARAVLAAGYPFAIGNLPALQGKLSQAIAESQQLIDFAPQIVMATDEPASGFVSGTPTAPQITFTTGSAELGSVMLELGPAAQASRAIPKSVVAILGSSGALRSDWQFNTLRLNS